MSRISARKGRRTGSRVRTIACSSVRALFGMFCAPLSSFEVRRRLMLAVGGDRGLIGPTRQFGTGTVYHGHLWALLVGAFLPVPIWWWQRRFPNTRLKHINIPVFLNGATFTPPATGINYSSWFLVGFIFREYPCPPCSPLIDLAGIGD